MVNFIYELHLLLFSFDKKNSKFIFMFTIIGLLIFNSNFITEFFTSIGYEPLLLNNVRFGLNWLS